MDRKKIVERAFLDAARKLSADIPIEQPIAGEEPDFLWPNLDFGLEVTEIRQPPFGDGFEPAQIESFRAEVACLAEREYRRGGGREVDVTLAFVTGHRVKQNAANLGKAVAAYVASHPPEDAMTPTHSHSTNDIPLLEGQVTITISLSCPGRPALWRPLQSGITILLTRDMLAATLASKEGKLLSYRKRASKIWLLVVCGMFPGSFSIRVPDDAILGWRFAHSFDGVLLLSQQDGKIWEITTEDS
jgi:hypothetical protein